MLHSSSPEHILPSLTATRPGTRCSASHITMACRRQATLLRISAHQHRAPAALLRPLLARRRPLTMAAPAAAAAGGGGATATLAGAGAAATTVDGHGASPGPVEAKKSQGDNEGIFSKHGGKMVLGFIGGIGLWFMRSHLGGKALDAVKDKIEAACPLEPVEVEELRCSNDYPPSVFEKVLDSARRAFPSGRATYPEFVRHVTSSGLLPEPLSMGFLLDRMALAAATHPGILGAAARGEATPYLQGGSEEWGAVDSGEERPDARRGDAVELELELEFLMVAFSVAVNTTPSERIRQLWDMARDMGAGAPYQEEGEGQEAVAWEQGPEKVIPASRAISIVSMLMASHQLPAGRYAVKDEKSVWPVQQYRLASGKDVFFKGLVSLHEDEEKRSKGWIERKLAPTYDPAKEVALG